MAPASLPGGELEYAVLCALWELGSGTARAVHEHVGAPSGLVYTTIAKVLDRLHAKRLVSRKRSGRAFVFKPVVSREQVERGRAKRSIADLLGGPAPAVAALVDAVESLDPRLLDELGRIVAERRRARRGS